MTHYVLIVISLLLWGATAENVTSLSSEHTVLPHPHASQKEANASSTNQTSINCWDGAIPPGLKPPFAHDVSVSIWTDTLTRVEAAVYVTIETFGPGTTSLGCDGVPRFRFTGSPTRTEAKTVGVVREFLETVAMARFCSDVASKSTTESTSRTILSSSKPDTSSVTQLATINLSDDARTSDQGIEKSKSAYNDDQVSIYSGQRGKHRDSHCYLDLQREVILFYWPSKTRSRNKCDYSDSPMASTTSHSAAPISTITTTAITFQGQDVYLLEQWEMPPGGTRDCLKYIVDDPTHNCNGNMSDVPNERFQLSTIGPSTLYGNFTFVSPTVYLAHHPITLSEVSKKFEYGSRGRHSVERAKTTVQSAGILPLHPDDISTMYPVFSPEESDGALLAQHIAQGNLVQRIKFGPLKTKRLNYADLQEPVPASIYFNGRPDCWGHQKHCSTVTEGNNRPALYINSAVWSNIVPPDMQHCKMPEVVDPSAALTRVVGGQEEGAPDFPDLQSAPENVAAAHQTPDPQPPNAAADDGPADLFGHIFSSGRGSDPARPARPAQLVVPALASPTPAAAGPVPMLTAVGPAGRAGGGGAALGDGSGEWRLGWGGAGPGAPGSRGGVDGGGGGETPGGGPGLPGGVSSGGGRPGRVDGGSSGTLVGSVGEKGPSGSGTVYRGEAMRERSRSYWLAFVPFLVGVMLNV